MSNLTVIANGLRAPEGPLQLADGSLIVCEMAAERLTRIQPDGSKSIAAVTGGTPNGAAIGPDGACYVCNRGKTAWQQIGEFSVPVRGAHELHGGGSIQRVDLATGSTRTLYTHCGDRELNGPNDLVFDAQGGLWFTDFGHTRKREMDLGIVYYAKPDGSHIQAVAHGMLGPNGIGLSPDGRWLYVAETYTCQLIRFEIQGPGVIRAAANPLLVHGGDFVGRPAGFGFFDSLAVDEAGCIAVATIGIGLTVFSPDGTISQISMPDPATTNLCFGGPDRRVAYVTLAATGKLVALPWERPGLRLNFGAN